ERFWETIQAELWQFVEGKVRDLSDGRARLVHFIAHYNHFRPHQGLDGATPADRFFGLESAVRRALEGAMDRNEYRLAGAAAPRNPLFLVGQIGDQAIALHGERGRVVVEMPDGTRREMSLEDLGTKREEEDRGDREPSERGGGEAAAAAAHGAQADGVFGAQDAGGGSRPLEGGERGGPGEGAQSGRGDPSGVAGEADANRRGEGLGDAAASVLAAQPAGGCGDGGGVPSAAASEAGAAEPFLRCHRNVQDRLFAGLGALHFRGLVGI